MLANNWIGILLGSIGGVLVWFITNWVGKPIIDIRDRRIKALHAAEENAHVGYGASKERIKEARAALNEAASGLRSISRGHGWPVRLYCLLARYDLERAADWLIDLHNRAGEVGWNDERRQIALDAIYILLRAHHHLSPKRIDKVKARIGLEERLSKEKL
jgi:truncated hemoglobin YjbI